MRTILGAFHAQTLTLTAATATHLVGSGATRPADGRKSLVVKNTSGAVLYIGGPGVTAANGYPLNAGEAFPADSVGGLYALSAAGGTVNILEGF